MANMYSYQTSFILTLCIRTAISFENCKPNVAVIGGGIGGASASHFLTELFHENIHIDLYEGKTIGGRLATVEINKNEYESGGAIIHPQNEYMRRFVELLGLERRSSTEQRMGLWNGDEFVFEESEWQLVSLAKLFYRYGVQPFSLNKYVHSVISDFGKIYDLQDAGISFANVTGLLTALNGDFPNLLQTPIKKHLLSLGYREPLIDDLVKATLVVNYGQDTDVQSFVGCVSLAGAGYDLWSVKGGNKKVPEHLIYSNGNVQIVPSYVKKIRSVPSEGKRNSYEVHYVSKDSTIVMKSTYDIVIIATPLTHDQKFSIKFEGFPRNDFYTAGEYHKTIATFVKADLKPQYFGLEDEIDIILSCNPNKTIISSLGRLNSVEGPTKDDRRIWKIFTNDPLKREILDEMFSNIDEIQQVVWKAYPEYTTDNYQYKFKLDEALYHVNAIEWAASAMEMSAIGGRNVALLAHQDYIDKCTKRSETASTDVPQRRPSTEL